MKLRKGIAEPTQKDMANRKVAKKINTLDGTEGPNVERCNTCGEVRVVEDFYYHGDGKVPSSKDKKGKRREQCKVCYADHRGRIPTPYDDYVPSNTLGV